MGYTKKLQLMGLLILGLMLVSSAPVSSVQTNQKANPFIMPQWESNAPNATPPSNEVFQSVLKTFGDAYYESKRVSPERKIASNLHSYLATGEIPENIVQAGDKVSIILTAGPYANIDDIRAKMVFSTYVELRFGYVFFGRVDSPDKLRDLAARDDVVHITGDEKIQPNRDVPEVAEEEYFPTPTDYRTREICRVPTAESEFGVDGSGVTISISDTGVDFAVPNLNQSMARLEDGG